MIAILSDIHSNIHALEAVLSDMPKVDAIYILGDMIGGACPFPCEVLDIINGLDVPVSAVLGNWEDWMIRNKYDIAGARTRNIAGAWTMEALQERHWSFLEGLDASVQIGDILIFHGSPENVEDSVITQEDADKLAKKHSARWLIGGHTHRAKVFLSGNEQRVVNASSVGASFDEIGAMACYALLDCESISFRHVNYDIESAVKAIETCELYKLNRRYADLIIQRMRTGVLKNQQQQSRRGREDDSHTFRHTRQSPRTRGRPFRHAES